jgi:hypothetical protein
MNPSFRYLALSLSVFWLAGIGATSAANETTTVSIAADDAQAYCVVEKRRGKRHEVVAPARIPIY